MAIINMQTMRYINLLDKASKVKTRKCFVYNGTIYFAVPRALMAKAIGPEASNIKRIQEKLGKKIKIIPEAIGLEDLEKFVNNVVNPVSFKNIEVKDNQVVVTAGGMQNKAALLGRNKTRYLELSQIIQDIFGKELRVI
jgi:NusA-like KH domain protein